MTYERLGPYKIGREIGKGGMGSVYHAVHEATGDVAAVKALAPHLGMAEGFRERFEAEIESLKKLEHGSIVRLYGYGEQDGVLFYAMEFVDGSSLEDELVAGRRFNWREVARIAVQVCRALKHAHDHGVVHRDIKPANLLLDKNGDVKIADFGIARLFGGTQLTSAGGVLGTADYMSPEQAEGRAVTERCDQYSLGGVIYALLAGRPPFRAKNLPEMLHMQRYAEPEPIGRFAPETPVQFQQVIAQLLAKDPADRFPNILVLRKHLEAMLKALSRPAPDAFEIAGADESESAALQKAESFGKSLALETTRVDLQAGDANPSSSEAMSSDGVTQLKKDVPKRRASITRSKATALTGPLTRQANDESELELEDSLDLRPIPADGSDSEPSRTASSTRFTTVEEESRRSQQHESPSWALQIGRGLALVSAIAAIVWGFLVLMRPPTADQLYDRIAEAADEDRVEKLIPVEDSIDLFLERFADDGRYEEVASFKESVETARMERQLNQVVSRGRGELSLMPVEQLYVDAVRLAVDRPDEAIRRLQSILAIYGPSDQQHSATQPKTNRQDERVETCLRLVDRRLRQYRRDEEARSKKHLPEIAVRMQDAERIAPSDPARAREIYSSIVALYSDSPWASSAVKDARRQLEMLAESGEQP